MSATPDEIGAARKAKRARTGRTNPDKQEAIIKLEAVSDRINHLIKLHTSATEAATDFNDAIKAVAEKAGLNASAVRKYVIARAGESFEDKKKEVVQLGLLFDIE